MTRDNTNRFSNRVEDYIRYRPTYPNDMIKVLENKMGLNNTKVIADIGSGTGLSSIPFLKNGNVVYAIEPNKEMREAQEHLLSGYSKFISVNGTAENTSLKPKSVDIIFSGQAFHWFDKVLSKKEFSKILKDNGNIVFVWNERSTKSDFQKEYEFMLYNNIEEYKNVNHRNIDGPGIEKFFSPKAMQVEKLDNEQQFDLDGLIGRLKSSSYCPKEGVVYEKLRNEIESLFSKYQKDNKITFQYETKIYWC